MLSEGLSYLEVQLISCRLSQTQGSQILGCHGVVGRVGAQGGLRGLRPCTGLVGLTGSPLSLLPAEKRVKCSIPLPPWPRHSVSSIVLVHNYLMSRVVYEINQRLMSSPRHEYVRWCARRVEWS